MPDGGMISKCLICMCLIPLLLWWWCDVGERSGRVLLHCGALFLFVYGDLSQVRCVIQVTKIEGVGNFVCCSGHFVVGDARVWMFLVDWTRWFGSFFSIGSF